MVIDEEGLCAFALHFNRMVERFRLTGEPVPEDPALPWRLAGIPLPELPLAVDGFQVADGLDCDTLLTIVAGGWLPEGAALWFYRRIPHAEGRDGVLEAVRSRGAAEALRRSRVKYESTGWMEAAPIDVFAAILDGSELDGSGVAVLQMCGEAILAPTSYCEARHLAAIGRYDPGWLARNAPAVVRACPARLGPLLSQLHLAGRNDLVVSAGVALAADPGVDRQALGVWLARQPAGPDTEEIRKALS